jgi:hypothetical protein
MPIIVKKPFSFSIEDIRSKGKDINAKDINAANRVEQVHPEFEEKPVLPSTSQSSEDVHGGSELTFSLPNSSQSNEQEQQQNGSYVNNQANQDTQGNTPAPNADTNNDNAADNSDNKGAQEQQNAGGEKSNDNNEVGDNAVNTDVDKQSNESGGTNGTQEPQSTANDTNQSAQEQENANAESSGDDQDGGDGNGDNYTEDQGQDGENDNESTNADNKSRSSVDNGDGDTNDTNADSNQEQENGDNNEQNSENDGEDGESEGEDEDEQSQSGVYNTQQVVDVIAVNVSSKYYQTEFYRFIELISEAKTRIFDPMGSEEFNIKKLMFRQFEKKPLNSYKMRRVREAVVILLDNSGSMEWWSNNLQVLAELAMQRNDVEIYLAPNGHIEEMLYPKRQLVNHDEIMKRLRNRKIIYVGDFDGADTPIILSWYNDVIWICPEERYIRFLEHNWVHYDESKFKGAFLRVFTLQELFSAFKKLLSAPTLRFWYDLCNETHRCGGDEDA